MNQFKTKNEYMEQFQTALDGSGQERVALTEYLHKQFEKLTRLIENISPENFWEAVSEVLGIDAKLTLLTELIPFEDFTNEEIVRIIENDYKSYFKELCGDDLKSKDRPSMIFNII